MLRALVTITLTFSLANSIYGQDVIEGNDQKWDDEDDNTKLTGDINNDKKVNITDLALLITILNNKNNTDGSISKYNGDINSDGRVDLDDVDKLKKIILTAI